MVKKNIKNTIKKHNLINANEHIVLGLSGGPDSVCLFYVLNELKNEMQFTLHAVHVNHGFRPGAAEEDQAYVEQICREMGVECTSYIFDCSEIAKKEGLSSEEAGRKVRYEAFVDAAGKLIAKGIPEDKIKIAVAQNADDQAETVLFRLLRGSGTDGLAGMAYRRYEHNVQVIRPLLDTWRKDIEAYCEEKSLAPQIDHTNLETVYTRNKIRLDLIPYLQENFNPNIMEALNRLSCVARDDKDFIWKCAEEAYTELEIAPGVLAQQGLAELAPPVRRRVVMKALQKQGLTQDVSYTHLEAADAVLEASGESKSVVFPGGYRMSVRYGEVAFFCIHDKSSQNVFLAAEVLHTDEYYAQNSDQTEGRMGAGFDYDKVKGLHGDAEVILRTRREGDFLAIKGGRKKLQDLYVDMKVPKEHRDNVLVAAVGSEVLWLPQQPEKGVKTARYNHRCKLDMTTKNVLKLEVICEI